MPDMHVGYSLPIGGVVVLDHHEQAQLCLDGRVIEAQSDLVDVVAVMQPRVVVMGGDVKSDDGD